MLKFIYGILNGALIVLVGVVVGFAQTATQPSGSGTSGAPYVIANLNNLYWVTQHSSSWGSYFVQTADIDASSDSTWNGGKGFTPIGTSTNTAFTGTYDGGGHTISGIYISVDSTDWIGVFGFCQFGSQAPMIDSLGVINERIKAGSDNNAGLDIGGLVGSGANVSITDCYTTGSVSGSNAVGGLVGYSSGATVSECYSADSVNGTNGNVGGLVGENYSSSTILNCYSTGSVGGTASNTGGLAGFNNSTISYSYSAGSVHVASFNVGGFIGADISGSTVDSCFWNKDSSGSTGIGNGTSAGATGITTVAMKDPFTFTATGWDTSYWYMGDGINDGYPYLKWQHPDGVHLVTAVAPDSGTGAPTAPYHIASLDNLYWLTQNPSDWDLYYIQTANIDASQTSGWNLGAGFSPIGNWATAFDGDYDGSGHTITGLCISYSDSGYVGLFGSIEATIDSIGLVNENISGGSDVGGLAGYSYLGTISNCYSTGAVSGNGATGRIGGLVGVNNDGTMSEDYSSASVSGQTVVGGLVGYNITSLIAAIIRNSYSLGSVSAADHVGGLVGESDGGLVGDTIGECYSTGSVTASGGSPNYAGGLVGDTLNNASVDSSFWDATTSGQSSSAGGTEETDAAMKTMSTFADSGWDFTNTWSINGATNYGYPYLQSLTDHSLSVQATDFVATAQMNSVTLSWKTQSEVDNAGFNLQREQSGTGGWQLVAGYMTGDGLRGLGTSTTGRDYTFTDNHVVSGTAYTYKIQSVSTDGATKDLSTLSVTVGVPKTYTLYQNYPNPFNPTTVVGYQLPAVSHVTLKIYDVLGREVATLVDGQQNAGVYKASFDGSRFASGVYFYRLTAAGNNGDKFVFVRKLVLLK